MSVMLMLLRDREIPAVINENIPSRNITECAKKINNCITMSSLLGTTVNLDHCPSPYIDTTYSDRLQQHNRNISDGIRDQNKCYEDCMNLP